MSENSFFEGEINNAQSAPENIEALLGRYKDSFIEFLDTQLTKSQKFLRLLRKIPNNVIPNLSEVIEKLTRSLDIREIAISLFNSNINEEDIQRFQQTKKILGKSYSEEKVTQIINEFEKIKKAMRLASLVEVKSIHTSF